MKKEKKNARSLKKGKGGRRGVRRRRKKRGRERWGGVVERERERTVVTGPLEFESSAA